MISCDRNVRSKTVDVVNNLEEYKQNGYEILRNQKLNDFLRCYDEHFGTDITSVPKQLYLELWGCGRNPGPNRLSLGGFACIRMKRESKL